MAEEAKSTNYFSSSKLTLYIIILSILYLAWISIYISVFKKEKFTPQVITGLSLVAFGIIGTFTAWFSLKTGSTFTYWSMILYTLSPIAFGIYLISQRKSETFCCLFAPTAPRRCL